jgi:hypothetical protein
MFLQRPLRSGLYLRDRVKFSRWKSTRQTHQVRPAAEGKKLLSDIVAGANPIREGQARGYGLILRGQVLILALVSGRLFHAVEDHDLDSHFTRFQL